MINRELYEEAAAKFEEHYGSEHNVTSYAPGRIEVLGNHTDYNEGFVFSAAIDLGMYFLIAPSTDNMCRLVAGDLMVEEAWPVDDVSPSDTNSWANYVKGVFDRLCEIKEFETGFRALFFSNLPLGAGLSSSAALEICSCFGMADLYGIELGAIEAAKIGQWSEHNYAGVKCGLMDQISSIYGKNNHLVMSDFRTLEIKTEPLGDDVCFLMCNSLAKHALVDGEYNERRASCEEAAEFFKEKLDRPISALRDVTSKELDMYTPVMPKRAAMRAAHVIGENERVLQGVDLLEKGDLKAFGELMFASHASSIVNFENSCPELDCIVAAAKKCPGVLGARLSGGGFGGSVVVLVHPEQAEDVSKFISETFEAQFSHPCENRVVLPSAGAKICKEA